MSALTVPARPDDSNLPHLPWLRMAWVTWRQHRLALTGVAVCLGGLAVYLWIVGHRLHHAYAAAVACHPASSIACGELVSRFDDINNILSNGYALQAVPALIGAFVGAPLLARELETGTFRYAWTQGFGRWRWTLAKLVLLAVVVAAGAGAFSVLISWYYQPYFHARNHTLALAELSPLAPHLFDLRGVVFGAWTLTAFAIGGLAGMLIRRVVPAIAATLAAYAGLGVVAANLLRPHYLTPLHTSNPNVSGSAWVVSQSWTKGGTTVSQSTIDHVLLSTLHRIAPAVHSRAQKQHSFLDAVQYVTRRGYRHWTSYQPAGRFWQFQLIEGVWLLALSLLLIAATVWLVHRRTA